MKLSLRKLALAVALFAGVLPALAQSYPFPVRSTATPVKCPTTCSGTNTFGQPNAGLPTFPYSSPIANHVGRIVDSIYVTDFQGGTGFATARARIVRLARETRGSAPPRAYVQLGSAIAIYSLDRFFTTTLPGGIVNVSTLVGKVGRGDYPNEKVAPWDAYIFPESPDSGWHTGFDDSQNKLLDFDIDDRGYVYVATGGHFGWGMIRDSGGTGGGQLVLSAGNQIEGDVATQGIPPDHIVALKVGTKYYAVASSDDNGRAAFDVSTSGAIVPGPKKAGGAFAFMSFAKDETRQRVAIVLLSGTIEIYDNSAFVTGGRPISTFSPPAGKTYRDVTVDENGNFWTSEKTSQAAHNLVVKLQRGSSDYTRETYDVYGENFTPAPGVSEGLSTINYGDKYLTVMGRTSPGGGADNDVKIFKIEGGVPSLVDVGDYFAKYYYKSPRDYALPKSVTRTMGAYPIKWNNKLYLIYNTEGLGDVYELQAGDSIGVTQRSGAFGTNNPYSKSTVNGPYYGDLMKFTATSSSSTQYALTWDFDNTESGADNTAPGNTGQDGEHQFSGLSTVAAIETVRHVKASANVNSETNGTVNVTLKVPTARIGIAGTNVALTTDSGTLDVVAGDQLTDASDGTIQGHYSSWTLDSTPTKLTPDTPLAAPAVGPHSLTLAAKYGKYSVDFVTNGSAFTDSVSNVTLTVRPFVISFVDPTLSGNAVTFKGSARVTQQSAILSAATWTVEWTLKNGATDVVPPQTSTANVGTIPNYQAPDRSAIPSGSILQLKVSVSSGLGTGVPAEYGTQTLSQTLLTPDPKINLSGCTNVGSPCSFTISSSHNPPYPTTDWAVEWTVKLGQTTVGQPTTLSASQTFTPTLTDPGSYTVYAKATTKLFEGNATAVPFSLQGVICGALPQPGEIAIYGSCGTDGSACDVGETLTVHPDSFTYQYQDCEIYTWNFGDGTAAVTTTAFKTTHKYTTKGTYTIKLTITKGAQTSSPISQSVKVGTTTTNPCDAPPAPANIAIEYFGNKNCSTGHPCKTTESVKFTAYRGTNGLLSCDSAEWSFGDSVTSSSVSPSHTFSNPNTYTVTVTVSNNAGQASASVQVPIVADDSGSCNAPPDANKVYIDYTGATSGCSSLNGKVCTGGEQIRFSVRAYLGSTIQSCDKFEWNFGDNSSLVTASDTQHSYVGNVPSYRVSVRAFNTSNSTGNVITADIPFPASIKPTPVLTYSVFPSTGTKGNVVTFTASSNIPATGWSWNFGDGPADNSQATTVGTNNTITHVFSAKGTYKVIVKARNADDVSSAQTSQVDRDIVIDETPEYRYLIPVVAHANGIGSVWRTDIQIYTADAGVTPQFPLALTVNYKGVNYPLSMPKSTMIFEDILDLLRPGQTEQGSMMITVKTQVAPQIWSRTYNQTESGTFGQFIPAILLNEAGGGSAVGEGMYYLAGLKSDARYRTNVGLVNPNAQEITAIVRLYDEQGLPVGQPMSKTLPPFQLDQFPVTGSANKPFSVEIEVPAGSWLIGYASLIDGGSSDPVYLQAIRASELGSADYRETMIPGVGHVGAWRSDVTVYNPNSRIVTVDLSYYNAAGTKLAEAKAVPINAGQFLQYSDILKQGLLGTVADGVGMLRVSVPTAVSADHFPMAYARTYNDNGSNKTYGQGIGGFAVNRANVRAGKSALIPGVRSNDKYYTNVGLSNISTTVATATVRVLDPNTGVEARAVSYTLQPNESIVATQFDLAGRANASLKVDVTGGNIWAFASIIDRGTFDPEYVPATPLP